MTQMLGKLIKATLCVAATPASLVVDLLTLPASAYNNEDHPFVRTEKLIKTAINSVELLDRGVNEG